MFLKIQKEEKYMNKICTKLKEYNILNKKIEIPMYDKDGGFIRNMLCNQTILKDGKTIGGITIDQSIDNIIHIGHMIICKEEQKNRNGTKVIALLFCLYPKATNIKALPTENSFSFPDSIGFWRKMGNENNHTGEIEITREEFIKLIESLYENH
ncbi:MAG: hypothetical protein WA144_06170 [Candidatus Methanoperedens sp.]